MRNLLFTSKDECKSHYYHVLTVKDCPVTMSDHITKSYQEGNGTSMRPYHSVWLAHWSRPGCKSANGAGNNFSTSGESGEESSQTKKRPLLDGPMPAAITAKQHDIGSGEVAGVSADNPNNESLTGRSKKRRKERLDSEPFPMLNVSQHRGGKLALNIEQATATSQAGALKFHSGSGSGHKTSSLDGKGSQSPSMLVPERGKPKKEHIKSKDITVYQHQHENSNKFLNNNALTVSPFVEDDAMGSASNYIPYGMDNRIPFTTYEQNINNEPSSYVSSKKQVGNTNFHTYSTLFVQETKINQLLDSTQATNALSRQHMRTFLLHNPSPSNLEQPNPYPIQCDTRKNSSNTLPFQSQSNHADTTLPEYLYHGGYSMQRLPFSVHDVETMRICTTVDSLGQALRGPPKFCQTTHRLMITKKTDVDLYEGQEFREAVASTNLKEKTTCALLSSSTNFVRHDQKENELLQPSSTVYGENEKFGNMRRATSYESSSETDIMDMDAYQENHLRGVKTSQTDKELRSSKSPLFSVSATGSVRKQIGDRLSKKRLLDINERPPNRSTSASLMDNGESSTSKTQTLDVEHLLSNAEQPRFSNSTVPPEDSSKREIDSGWVKRLRPCASESVHDTKSTKKEEDSSCDKANQLFNKMKCSSTSSDRSRGPLHGQEQLAVGHPETILKDSDLSSNLRLKNREMILSNPWIRRLCHDRPVPSERNLETAVVHKSQCSKPTLNQPFPSIAAMALMGKTVTGLQPCEFSRRGSSLVWNNEGI